MHCCRHGDEAATHWAYIPPRPVEPPALPASESPIDRFVRARLAQEGIEPSPPADRATLIRRVTLDLIGLPPTPLEVDAFVNDSRADAFERVVDRLLASEHFGERWARWWLDLAHYADSDGYLQDFVRPMAWRYRQWVVDAFNRDLPFDQFTIEQLAGDLLPGSRRSNSESPPAFCATRSAIARAAPIWRSFACGKRWIARSPSAPCGWR